MEVHILLYYQLNGNKFHFPKHLDHTTTLRFNSIFFWWDGFEPMA